VSRSLLLTVSSVDEAASHPDVGDIGHPKLVWSGGSEISRTIGEDRVIMLAVGSEHETSQWPHLEAVFPA
jgi:hypothetical protein